MTVVDYRLTGIERRDVVRVSVGVVVRGELERRSAVVVVRVVHADAIAVVHVATETLQLAAVTSPARAHSTHLYYLTLL